MGGKLQSLTRILCVVQVGHHYSATVAQFPGAIDTNAIRSADSLSTQMDDRLEGGPDPSPPQNSHYARYRKWPKTILSATVLMRTRPPTLKDSRISLPTPLKSLDAAFKALNFSRNLR